MKHSITIADSKKIKIKKQTETLLGSQTVAGDKRALIHSQHNETKASTYSEIKGEASKATLK